MIHLVVGLGLIGGSLAKALSAHPGQQVWGLDTSRETLDAALAEGAIAKVVSGGDLAEADITWICLHPRQALDFILGHADDFGACHIVTDVCGVKTYLVYPAHQALRERGVRYVGCHPMAGREFSGYAYAQTNLFEGASFILTPLEDTDRDAVECLRDAAAMIGFGRVVVTTPEHHDQVIAFSSQLAHVVSNAYVKSPMLQDESGFSAGSFQDMTRVARLNADMWTDLFLANSPALSRELEGLIGHLEQYRDAIARQDGERLRRLLEEGNALKLQSIQRDGK
jgi:prephenate dehydrogenase